MFNKMCSANRISHTRIAHTHTYTASDLKEWQQPISFVNCSITATEEGEKTFLQLKVM